jgi:hypothetical protein
MIKFLRLKLKSVKRQKEIKILNKKTIKKLTDSCYGIRIQGFFEK